LERDAQTTSDVCKTQGLWCKEIIQKTRKEKQGSKMKCYVCNDELIWGGDHDIEEDEFFHEDNHTIHTNLSCPKCGAYVEVYHGNKQED
jgi:hypothetical protein